MSILSVPAHLRLTQNFIAQNPITVNIKRRARVSTGTGGSTQGAETTPEPGLVARLVLLGPTERTAPDGSTVLVTGTLVCMPDADVQHGDRFDVGTTTYIVLSSNVSPPWRRNCEVYRAS